MNPFPTNTRPKLWMKCKFAFIWDYTILVCVVKVVCEFAASVDNNLGRDKTNIEWSADKWRKLNRNRKFQSQSCPIFWTEIGITSNREKDIRENSRPQACRTWSSQSFVARLVGDRASNSAVQWGVWTWSGLVMDNWISERLALAAGLGMNAGTGGLAGQIVNTPVDLLKESCVTVHQRQSCPPITRGGESRKH